MELIEITDQFGRMSGVVLKDDTVLVMGNTNSTFQTEYAVKEFDRFVAAYRKARRDSKVTAEAPTT